MLKEQEIVLITGASGMLGKDMCSAFKEKGAVIVGNDLREPMHKDLDDYISGDLTNPKFLDDLLLKVKPSLIIHCAAIVDVDGCENNRELADKLHIQSSGQLASYNTNKTRILYISTDSVFDGMKGNYSEADTPNPLNYYALTKFNGEKVILKNNPNSLVLRTNIYGFNYKRGKSLAEWALSQLQNNSNFSGFTDVLFNPVYTSQLAEIALKLAFLPETGIINAVSSKPISKYDYLVKFAEIFGYSSGLISEKSVDSVIFKAPRPKNTTLNPEKLQKILGYVPDLMEGLHSLKKDMESAKAIHI